MHLWHQTARNHTTALAPSPVNISNIPTASRLSLDTRISKPLNIRIGINTGYCNVGNFGSDQRLTYTIIGSEVNVAQRLEASAEPGGILMSYETYAHAPDLIEVEQLESISMKGVNKEIKVFSVLDELKKANKKYYILKPEI